MDVMSSTHHPSSGVPDGTTPSRAPKKKDRDHSNGMCKSEAKVQNPSTTGCIHDSNIMTGSRSPEDHSSTTTATNRLHLNCEEVTANSLSSTSHQNGNTNNVTGRQCHDHTTVRVHQSASDGYLSHPTNALRVNGNSVGQRISVISESPSVPGLNPLSLRPPLPPPPPVGIICPHGRPLNPSRNLENTSTTATTNSAVNNPTSEATTTLATNQGKFSFCNNNNDKNNNKKIY